MLNDKRQQIGLEDGQTHIGLVAKLKKHAKAKGMTSPGYTKDLLVLAIDAGLHLKVKKRRIT